LALPFPYAAAPLHALKLKSPAQAEKATEADVKTLPVNGFLAIGLPSVWERPKSLWDVIGAGRPVECIDFSIRATGAVPPEVQITTTGIGGATLLDLTKPHGTCSESAIPGSSVVTIAKAATTDHWLRLAVRERAFPELAQGAKGGLVFLATPDRPPLEVELTLRRQGFPAAFEAPLWFLGIGVPALLTAWVGFIFTRWQKDRETNSSTRASWLHFGKAKPISFAASSAAIITT